MGLTNPSGGGGEYEALILRIWATSVGSLGIQLPITIRPPGRVTRTISLATSNGLGANIAPKILTTRSNALSGNCSKLDASPSWNVQLVSPCSLARLFPASTRLRAISTPSTSAPSFAAGIAVVPSPHPRSRTLSPLVIPSCRTSASPLSRIVSAIRAKSPFSQRALFGFKGVFIVILLNWLSVVANILAPDETQKRSESGKGHIFLIHPSQFLLSYDAACISEIIVKRRGMKIALLAGMTLIGSVATAICTDAGVTDQTIGINPAYRNLSVKPGDDFEEYANGGWRKTAEIPADRASTGAGFEVFERAEKRNADLVREVAARNPQPDTPQGMIAAYYAAFMDTANIEKRGLDPLKEKLREIDAIKTKTDLARVLGERLRADVDPLNATMMWTENLFGVWVTQALSEPDRTVPYLLQGGLGMPDREYYVSDKPEMAKLRNTYQKYIEDLMKLADMSDPAGRAERIVALEKKMATVHLDRVTSQDVHKANNPATLADLKSNAL